MKFSAALLSILVPLTSSALTISPTSTENNDPAIECGDLGVMIIPAADLPEGVLPSDVRKCREHPLGRNRYLESASLAPLDPVDVQALTGNTASGEARSEPKHLNTSEPQACYRDAPYGCSKGYCWKVCGSNGEWCWTAKGGGAGAWYTCNRYQNCGTGTMYVCGRNCPSCGCGC
ncbi:uncharacterized protein BO95DRAFT_505203 [Aspergillus brunneoviolaceus CBS 621.78]|uniref:Uncharacterized protein n=1 Tax=Aspergillus brunneoviolaceus CBS 621.78 TaxID=1450534 RepID=A0ACD1GL51_9EURO|nr:hypothetical protein BO95DRAFT_505203 [Aspergillus brunneoviolaceus CBS 621.78]RAH49952.1 hypothetical protein BO95DRAFT_505203 [Aspergillus brunneoviolaceus CBS 621.78]